jgi:hypothetical protein
MTSSAESQHHLHVVVHFAAAPSPFEDKHADPHETIGHLKKRVLEFFHLHEGEGGVVYTLFHGTKPLEDPAQTLGAIAGHERILRLKLAQQITQGNGT